MAQNGLIRTNDNCVGCNKCISVCSCVGATVAHQTEDGRNIIDVDGNKCIACGACKSVCPQKLDVPELITQIKDMVKELEG